MVNRYHHFRKHPYIAVGWNSLSAAKEMIGGRETSELSNDVIQVVIKLSQFLGDDCIMVWCCLFLWLCFVCLFVRLFVLFCFFLTLDRKTTSWWYLRSETISFFVNTVHELLRRVGLFPETSKLLALHFGCHSGQLLTTKTACLSPQVVV